METVQSAFGFLVLAGLAWALGENRRWVRPRVVIAGLALQVVLALALIKLPPFQDLFLALSRAVTGLQEATGAGTSFVFGYLGGGPAPFETTQPGASFILAFRALPLILVVSALSALLFYWRILPLIVRALAWCLERSLGVGGAVGLSAAANIFVGMTEAPILIRPYLKELRRGELFMVMACGMATIAGTVMVVYATILAGVIPNVIGHILTASIISAPAAIVVAHLMVPDVSLVAPGAGRPVVPRSEAKSAMDAVARGATDGMRLLINVIALLVVLVALVHLVNQALGLLPDLGAAPITLQRLFGYLFAPIAWLMGVPWAEAVQAGALIGTKTVLNEFIAYMDLAALPPEALSARTRLILTYALCGFANFGSLGILIAGLATMAPERRAEIAGLGMKAIVAGTLATCMTGAVIGML